MSGGRETSKGIDLMAVSQSRAVKFIILMGVVSLFADVTYEGARSITGPFLGSLGASGMIVGIAAGAGELMGYTLRLLSGYLSDRTGRYWTITLVGYAVNLIAVPMLALAGRWEIATGLIIAERLGKGLRTPARDAMLSYATSGVGAGWGFGLHEALDQIGAILGPLTVSAVLFFGGGYRSGFMMLLVPALIAIAILSVARVLYPHPRDMERSQGREAEENFPKAYWVYLAAASFIAMGYVDYALIAYHFGKTSSIGGMWIPTFYAVAMGLDAVSALIFGRVFDRVGLGAMIIAVMLSMLFAPLVFLGGFRGALVGVMLWGVGMGAQESIMRAGIARMVPMGKRGIAYGMFNASYGVFWFIGSWLMGYLYDISVPGLIGFSVVAQAISIPIPIAVKRYRNLP